MPAFYVPKNVACESIRQIKLIKKRPKPSFHPKPRLPSLVSFVHETRWAQPALLAVATGCTLPPDTNALLPDANALLPDANAAFPLDATFGPQAAKKNTLAMTIAIRTRVFFI